MSNQRIVAELLRLTEEFQHRKLSATDLEDAVERHVQAMEGITQAQVAHCRDLSYALVSANLKDETGGPDLGEEVELALEELRSAIFVLGRYNAT